MTTQDMLRKISVLLFAVLLASSAVSCEDSREEPLPDPEFSLDENSIDATSEGGESSVRYTLENPQDNLQVVVGESPEWISGFDTSVEGSISFIVAPNDKEEVREATIPVYYGELSDSFTVRQDALVVKEYFEITFIEDKTELTSLTFTVSPSDKEMAFICAYKTKSEFDSYVTPQDLIKEDIAYMKDYAKKRGMTLEEYLEKNALRGDQPARTLTWLDPDTQYTVYAYGVDSKGKAVTDLFTETAGTRSVVKSDVDFDFSIDVTGPDADIAVTPTDKSIYYFTEVIPKEEYSDDASLYEDFQERLIKEMKQAELDGTTPRQYVKMYASRGDNVIHSELEPLKQYIVYAVAVDFSGILISDLSSKSFDTEGIPASDNVITIEVTELSSRDAKIKVTATNDDTFFFGIDPAANWKGLSDEQIIDKLTKDYDLEKHLYSGSFETTATSRLPDTEYVILAFGYSYGYANTDLVKLEFRTLQEERSDVTFKLLHDKYFDGNEAKEKYPDIYVNAVGKAVLPVKADAQPVERVKTYYYSILSGYVSPNDDEVINFLLQRGVSHPATSYLLPFGQTMTIVGFAVDNDGKFGPLSRETIYLTREGVSPIEELSSKKSKPKPYNQTTSLQHFNFKTVFN